MVRSLTKNLSDGTTFQYQVPWDGERWSGYKMVAIDTETPAIEDHEIPPSLVLASVSNGTNHALLYPYQVADFLNLHWDFYYVAHNLAFDWWVLADYLLDHYRQTEYQRLEDLVTEGRFLDSMLLDQLLQLARSKGEDFQFFRQKNLDLIGQEYAGLKVAKDDPYRLRYGEIMGKSFEEVEEGFLGYAIQDAVVLWRAVAPMLGEAKRLLEPLLPKRGDKTMDVYHDAQRRFGLLSVGVQAKAAIVLADIQRRGVAVSQEKVAELEQRLRGELESRVSWIRENHPELLSFYKVKAKRGQLMVNKATQVPHLKVKTLKTVLGALKLQEGVKVPKTPKTGDITTALGVWRDIAPHEPLVQQWGEMADIGKLLQFVMQVKGQESVHPRYYTLVQTGRTSCTRPNIQQMPKEEGFRDVFVPRPGYKFAAIDYSFIELRTLASVCLAKFGQSRLADVIVAGIDPHEHTAALVVGIPVAEFREYKTKDPALYKKHRQAAKALNFGVPGGLGAAKLVQYAKVNYGVSMSQDEAARFKRKLTSEVYPELDLYLADGSLQDLASNLRANVARVKAVLGIEEASVGLTMGGIRKIVRGEAYKKDGTPYSPWWVAKVWNHLESLCNSEDRRLVEGLARREGSPWLEERLFGRTVATLTGRLRSGVSYTEARNTPFQGLAADGAKLALWELWRAGFRIVAFIHDEILLEVVGEEEAKRAAEIMNQAMGAVLHPLVPCACEFHVGDCWEKP